MEIGRRIHTNATRVQTQWENRTNIATLEPKDYLENNNVVLG